MEKTFTINVPDEIWVNSWNDNKTETYTYNGPSVIKVLVETKGEWGVLNWSESDFGELQDHETVVDITVDDSNVAVAHWLVSKDAEHTYTYTAVDNHDGSQYDKMDNPRIQDYFEIGYNPQDGFKLLAIYKKTETSVEMVAKERKEFVKKYDDAYDFDADTQTTIDNFLTAIDTYLTAMETVYPWKYVAIDKSEVPKIPASLITAFKELPEIV